MKNVWLLTIKHHNKLYRVVAESQDVALAMFDDYVVQCWRKLAGEMLNDEDYDMPETAEERREEYESVFLTYVDDWQYRIEERSVLTDATWTPETSDQFPWR
jgi:hypothetical protein